jgi:hypothetical protein
MMTPDIAASRPAKQKVPRERQLRLDIGSLIPTFTLTIYTLHTMVAKNTAFDLQKCARSNILALEPYRCARE